MRFAGGGFARDQLERIVRTGVSAGVSQQAPREYSGADLLPIREGQAA
jgi:hypothetical protein